MSSPPPPAVRVGGARAALHRRHRRVGRGPRESALWPARPDLTERRVFCHPVG